ncbi:hypothetical protein ACJX0J_018745, partial [Zea mays]
WDYNNLDIIKIICFILNHMLLTSLVVYLYLSFHFYIIHVKYYFPFIDETSILWIFDLFHPLFFNIVEYNNYEMEGVIFCLNCINV